MLRFNLVRNCATLTKKIGFCEGNSIARLYATSHLSKSTAVVANNGPLKTHILQNNFSQPPLQLQTTQSRNSSATANHVKIWQLERMLSVALLPLLPVAVISENCMLEALLALGTVVHTHWGLEAIVVDYARPAVIGAVLAKGAHLLLNLFSIITLAGLLVLVFSQGIGKSIKKGWALGKGGAKA